MRRSQAEVAKEGLCSRQRCSWADWSGFYTEVKLQRQWLITPWLQKAAQPGGGPVLGGDTVFKVSPEGWELLKGSLVLLPKKPFILMSGFLWHWENWVTTMVEQRGWHWTFPHISHCLYEVSSSFLCLPYSCHAVEVIGRVSALATNF